MRFRTVSDALGNQNDFINDGVEVDNRHAENIFQQTVTDVADIIARSEYCHPDLPGGGLFFNHPVCVIGGFCFDVMSVFRFQALVFEQHDMTFKNFGLFRTEEFFQRFSLMAFNCADRCGGLPVKRRISASIVCSRDRLLADNDRFFF